MHCYCIAEAMHGPLIAYYLPWQYNTGYHIILEVDSPINIMFTATLTGCAVGDIMAKDGSAGFSHHNINSDAGRADAPAMRQSLSFNESDNLMGNQLNP